MSPPPARVVDYLKDFSNAEEWDPGTQTCSRSDSGPLTEGASWHNVSNIFGGAFDPRLASSLPALFGVQVARLDAV